MQIYVCLIELHVMSTTSKDLIRHVLETHKENVTIIVSKNRINSSPMVPRPKVRLEQTIHKRVQLSAIIENPQRCFQVSIRAYGIDSLYTFKHKILLPVSHGNQGLIIGDIHRTNKRQQAALRMDATEEFHLRDVSAS